MKTNSNSNTKCELIRDLMPLYIDRVISDAGCELVHSHLKECRDCRAYCHKLRSGLRNAAVSETDISGGINNSYSNISKKIRREKTTLYSVTTVASLAFLTMGILKIMVYLAGEKDGI